MNRDLFAEAGDVFLAVRGARPGERTRLLEARCAGRPELRHAVEGLLSEDGQRGDGFDDSAMVDGLSLEAFQGLSGLSAPAAGDRARPHLELPDRIGRFRIIRLLGEGGMGVVCEAEQDSPRRRVALKLLRNSLSSTGLARRFEREAQVLAGLQHPGIARIYESGAAETPSGLQPYFAMELIEGMPLLDHARAVKMSVPRRLALFLKVCEAVEYAHRRGVVHRDLKPANILVDEHGNPRVLDFGVARVTDSDLQVATVHTHAGQLVGTLPYMSPEQVSGNPHAVDTRTDVYALGIILFELLSGKLPYDTRSKSLADAARTIRDQEPTRLGTLDTALRGDLDVIVSRALEKDVDRRYPSVEALAADVHRHLRHEPIEARPNSRMYQIAKFARRHPELIAGIAVAAIALAAGTVVSTWGFVRAVSQRDLAERNAGIAKDREAQAQAAAQRARRLTDAMSKLMAVARPSQGPERAIGTVGILRDAAEEIVKDLADDPEAERRFRLELSDTLAGVRDIDGAILHASEAYEIGKRLHGPASIEALRPMERLAAHRTEALCSGDRTRQYAMENKELIRTALRIARESLGKDHEVTLALLMHAAQTENYEIEGAPSLEVCEAFAAQLRTVPPERRPCSLAKALSWCANCSGWLGPRDKCAAYTAEAIKTYEEDPASLDAACEMWGLKGVERNPRHGLEFLRRELPKIEAKYGVASFYAESVRRTLMMSLATTGEPQHALKLYEMDRIMSRHRWPGDHAKDLWELSAMASLQARTGRLEESRSTYEEVLGLFQRIGDKAPARMGEEIWRKAELALHFQTFGDWKSTSLRDELRYAVNRMLARESFAGYPLGSIDWDSFEARMTPIEGGEARVLRVPDVYAEQEPAHGVYRLEIKLKVKDKALSASTVLSFAPWRVRRYTHAFLDLNVHRDWQQRTSMPHTDEVTWNSLTHEVWWENGFGPCLEQYRFGLIAETDVAYPAGTYSVVLDADDGGRVELDGRSIIEAWPDRRTDRNTSAVVTLTGRPQHWRVEYAQFGGPGRLRLYIAPASAQTP